MASYLFLQASARTGGNAELLARTAAEALPGEHTQTWFRLTDYPRGRTLYLTCAMAGDDPAEAEPLVRTLQLTADYMRMHWGGSVLAHANAAGDVRKDPAALAEARRLLAPGDTPA